MINAKSDARILEGVRVSQRGCVSEIGGGPFQSEGMCISWRGGVFLKLEGVFLFWNRCVKSGGGAFRLEEARV